MCRDNGNVCLSVSLNIASMWENRCKNIAPFRRALYHIPFQRPSNHSLFSLEMKKKYVSVIFLTLLQPVSVTPSRVWMVVNVVYKMVTFSARARMVTMEISANVCIKSKLKFERSTVLSVFSSFRHILHKVSELSY